MTWHRRKEHYIRKLCIRHMYMYIYIYIYIYICVCVCVSQWEVGINGLKNMPVALKRLTSINVMFVGVVMAKNYRYYHGAYQYCELRYAIQLLFNFNYMYMCFTLCFRSILALLRLSLSKSVWRSEFSKTPIFILLSLSLCPFCHLILSLITHTWTVLLLTSI